MDPNGPFRELTNMRYQYSLGPICLNRYFFLMLVIHYDCICFGLLEVKTDFYGIVR